MGFRGDINGLRAIAVLGVVLFHFYSAILPGGFAGVDVFFVISGFLMTSIIYSKICSSDFSLLGFYMDRARRLVPAIVVLCAVLLFWGYFGLLPIDYKLLGDHIVSALLFYSNIIFFSESGYFDTSSHLKWLLHTWSLSVEWQFYIVYPLLLLFLSRFFRREVVKSAVVVLAFSSFAFAVYASYLMPSFAYYMLPTRAWEMMLGGVLVLFPIKVGAGYRVKLSYAGLLMVFGSFFFYDKNTVWPGAYALLPVLGTCLIVLANNTESFLANSRALSWLGKISYSTYLWHWPVCVYLYVNKMSSNMMAVVAGIALSFLLGFISYRFVENITRKNASGANLLGNGSYKAKYIAIVLSFFFVFFGGLAVEKTNGVTSRMDDEIKYLSEITDVYKYFNFASGIRYGTCHSVPLEVSLSKCIEQRKKMLFIWGDSYAASLYQGLVNARDNGDMEYGISQMTDGNGPPFFIDTAKTDDGKTLFEANAGRLQAVQKFKPDVILISWMIDGKNAFVDKESTLAALRVTIDKIKLVSPDSKIVVVGPVPRWKGNLVSIVLNYWTENKSTPPQYMKFGLDGAVAVWDSYFKVQIPALGVNYLSAYDEFCNSEGCLTRIGKDIADLPVIDWGHLSAHGAIYLVNRARNTIFLN